MKKIILSADSTCDLNEDIVSIHNIEQYPYTIIVGDKTYKDNIDITPNKIYEIYKQKNILPKTASINVSEYYDYFKPWVKAGHEIIHINLASSLTSAHNNCRLAAAELEGVYVIDSFNLSTGSALLVLKAADLIEKGYSAKEISLKLNNHRQKIHMSFILNTLDFLYAGGRCSKIASLGANLLKIKPVINVDNQSGSMTPGSRYKGSLEKSISRYINDKLSSYNNINKDNIFIVHSGIEDKYIKLAKDTIANNIDFKKVFVTKASCTISSHCGPRALGIAFETL